MAAVHAGSTEWGSHRRYITLPHVRRQHMNTDERFEAVAETVSNRVGAGVRGSDRDLIFFDAWWLDLQAGVGGLIQWAGNSGSDRVLRTARSLEKIGFEKALPIVRSFLKLIDEAANEGAGFETALRRVNINRAKTVEELDTAWEDCAAELRSRTLDWWAKSSGE